MIKAFKKHIKRDISVVYQFHYGSKLDNERKKIYRIYELRGMYGRVLRLNSYRQKQAMKRLQEAAAFHARWVKYKSK